MAADLAADSIADLGSDRLTLYGAEFSSRLLAGTAQYPSPAVLSHAIVAAKAEIDKLREQSLNLE